MSEIVNKCGTPSNSVEAFEQKAFLLNTLAQNTTNTLEESKELVSKALSANESQENISA